MILTLIWFGFLGACFEVGRGEGKITPPPPSSPVACLKLVKIKLETSNLERKYTSICSFRKHAL